MRFQLNPIAHYFAVRAFVALACTASLDAASTKSGFTNISPGQVKSCDGTTFSGDLESQGWTRKPTIGNGGVLETSPGGETTPAILMMQVGGLEAGAVYEMFGYFWADGFDGTEVNERQFLPTQFGCTLAELQTYDGPTPQTDEKVGSWMVAPGVNTGEAYGYHAALVEENPLQGLDAKLITKHGDSRLVRARIGFSRADASGSLPVFFAGYPYTKFAKGVSRIDGVAVRKVKHQGPLEMGWKAGTRLHLAIRAGDPVTIQRELAAGADVNGFDEENLTPLFYACGADDVELAKQLLEKGADPNIDGQSVLPLTAVASMDDVKLVRLLLDFGAKLPLQLADDHGKLEIWQHPAAIHPVIAAIHGNAVQSLKLLLESEPRLRIEELYSFDTPKKYFRGKGFSPSPFFVKDAIGSMRWGMALLLLENGCRVLPDLNRITDHEMRDIAFAVEGGEEAMRLIDGLIDAGVPPVHDIYKKWQRYRGYRQRSFRSEGFAVLRPKDMLERAVASDIVPLVKRFLPLAGGVTPRYQDELYVRALQVGNPEVIRMVKEQFPDVAPARWAPQHDKTGTDDTYSGEALSSFLPRTITPKHNNLAMGKNQRVLAVLSAPGAEDVSASLSAVAAGQSNWSVVDRELIEEVLIERGFSKPWEKGEHRMGDLGDRFSADSIIIVSVIKGKEFSVYAFEVVEVMTGLVVHREHLNDKEMDLQADLGGILDRAYRALDAAAGNVRHEAVTLLPFSAQPGVSNPLAIARWLRATVQRQVDESPGMISLTREQTKHVIEEQAMQGVEGIWAAAHLVEGGVAPAGRSRIKVTLRLETFHAGGLAKRDAEVEGTADELPELAAKAWKKLFADGRVIPVERDPAVAERMTKLEAERLLREAKWLNAVHGDSEYAVSLAEAALALGAPPAAAIPVHLENLFARITSICFERYPTGKYPGRSQRTITRFSTSMPDENHIMVMLDVTDRIAHDLPKLRQLLQQTAFHLATHGERIMVASEQGDHTSNYAAGTIWAAIKNLSYVRSTLNRDLIPAAHLLDYDAFVTELELLTCEFFELQQQHAPTLLDRVWVGPMGVCMQHNPELKKGYTAAIVRSKQPEYMLWFRGAQKFWPEMTRGIASSLEGWLTSELPRKTYLQCLSIRHLSVVLDPNRQLLPYFLNELVEVMEGNEMRELDILPMLKNEGLPLWQINYPEMCPPHHASSLIPSLVHMPRMAPDLRMRWQLYFHMMPDRYAIPRGYEARARVMRDRKHESRFNTIAENQLERGSPDGQQDLLNATSLLQLLFGYSFRETLSKRYALELEAPADHISPVLMADLREHTVPYSGIVLSTIVDRSNPQVLWMHYLASSQDMIPEVKASPLGNYNTNCMHSWLVAYDCGSGKILHRINLKKAAGEAMGKNLNSFPIMTSRKRFCQTDDFIMTNVDWWDHERDRSINSEVSLVINKKTGRIQSLPSGVCIGGNPDGAFGLGNRLVYGAEVVALDGNFYFTDRIIVRNERNYSVYRLDPARMKLDVLVQHGRRPALTPFDPEDRAPKRLTLDGKRLVVYDDSDSQHSAYYDPNEDSWVERNGPREFISYSTRLISRRDRAKTMEPIHSLQLDGKETGYKIEWDQAMAGCLPAVSATGAHMRIPVTLEIPEEFRKKTKVIVRYGLKPGHPDFRKGYSEMPFDEYVKSEELTVHVLNQNKDDLVLGLQIGRFYEWEYQMRQSLLLPFLWKVSKKELLDTLEAKSE